MILDETFSTPTMENALSTPNLALFSTTSRRRLEAIKKGDMPSGPVHTPVNPCRFSFNITLILFDV